MIEIARKFAGEVIKIFPRIQNWFVQLSKKDLEIESLKIRALNQEEKIKEQKERIDSLSNTFNEVCQLIKEKQDPISIEVRLIISKIGQDVEEFMAKKIYFEHAADWIEWKTEEWIKFLKNSDQLNVSENQELFLDEIRQHLLLLQENLRGRTFGAPDLCGIKRHIKLPFPYTRALRAIQTQMNRELEASNDLDRRATEELKRYTERLIADIL